MNVVDDALLGARQPGLAGQLRTAQGDQPAYLFWLRDEQQQLAGGGRRAAPGPAMPTERKPADFSFAHSLLAPGAGVPAARTAGAAHHRGAESRRRRSTRTGAAAGGRGATPDMAPRRRRRTEEPAAAERSSTSACTRRADRAGEGHRAGAPRDRLSPTDTSSSRAPIASLLSMAQIAREPVILNDTQSPAAPGRLPYRVLCCPVRIARGRSMGVLALLREPPRDGVPPRDAHVAEILARGAGVVETSYDALSGLYTRPAFEQRVRSIVAERKPSQRLERAVRRRRPAARHQRKLRHARRRCRHRPARRADPRAPAARGASAARISGDRFTVLLPTEVERRRALRRIAARRRRDARRAAAEHAHPHVDQHRRRAAGDGRGRSSRIRWPRPRPPARPPRTAAATASRLYQVDESASSAASPTSTSPTRVREALTHNRLRLDAQLIAAVRRPPRARRTTNCCCA